jgi:hypothetical protein
MPQRRAIPENPELHSEIMVRVAEGKTNGEIAHWLTKKLGRKINRHHVQDVVRERRAEREEATRAVLEQEAGKTALADLSYIGQMLCDAHEIQCSAMPGLGKSKKKGKPFAALKAIEVQRKLIEMRYALLGVGKLPTDPSVPKGSVIILPPEDSG